MNTNRLLEPFRDWTVVGTFDAGKSGFGSEIWADTEQIKKAQRTRLWAYFIGARL